MKKKPSEYERFMTLTDAQKKAETAIFDQEDLTPGKPISPAERRRFQAWQNKAMGRPRVGEGFRRWNVSLEKTFARAADTYAKQHGKTRSSLIVEALTLYIQKVA